MKRFLFIIAVIMSAAASFAQEQADNVMYVYRNDGGFEAFYYSEVDSMTYSNLGVDGYSYDDIVTQEVWTEDSLYRIPLAAIDSIGFSTPPAIINKDVFVFTSEHDPYLFDTGTLAFTMKASTPKDMRPSKGSIVVADISCMAFQYGIMARVISITETEQGYRYECEQAGLDDVYDQLVCYYDGKTDETPAARANDVEDETVRIDLWEKSFEKTWKETDTSGEDRTDININAQDAGYLTMKVCKLFTKDCYANFCLHNDFESSFTLHAETEKEFRPAPRELFTANMGRIRTPVYLIWIVPKLRLYGYLEAYGRADLDFAAHLNRYDAVTFEYANQEWNVSYGGNTDTGVDVAKLSLKGTAEVGVQPEIMLSINGFETGIGLSSRFGCKKEADFYFDAVKYFDTGTYDAIKDSEVRTYNTYSLSAFAQIGIFKASKPGEIKIAKIEEHTGTDYLVPKFSELYKQNIDDNTRSVVLAVDNNVVLPMNISLGLYDKNDELIYEVDDGDIYDGTDHKYAYYLNNVDAYPGCKAYPIIRFGEIEMRATPAIEMTCPAKFDRAECTEAYYYPDFSYPNVMDICFHATLEDMTDIVEWGLYLGDGELYPFKEVSEKQSMEMGYAVNGQEDGITLDYSNFIFDINGWMGVYAKKRNSDGSISTILAPYAPYNVRYDTKPSATISNPVITGTSVIDTDVDKNGNTIYRYKTEYSIDLSVEGALWIDYINGGVSGGNWQFSENENEPWTPGGDWEGRIESDNGERYWSNTDVNHTSWYNLHLRNGSGVMTSNYLNFYGTGDIITGVSVTSSPMFTDTRSGNQTARTVGNKRANYVEDMTITDITPKRMKENEQVPVICLDKLDFPGRKTAKDKNAIDF